LNKIQTASRQSPHEHGLQSIIRAVGITSRRTEISIGGTAVHAAHRPQY
jgi:hypothetical protein